MPPSSASRSESVGRRLRDRVSRVQWRSGWSSISSVGNTDHPQIGLPSGTGSRHSSQIRLNHSPAEDESSKPSSKSLLPTNYAEGLSRAGSVVIDNVEHEHKTEDVWSAAFREAVIGFGEKLDVAILEGKSIHQIFTRLEEMDRDANLDSVFLRGVNYLQAIEVPLRTFKLAIDLASPLASLEPTAKIVFGVLTGVTAIAISFASADLEFGKQIGEMLRQLSYVDECDTLGQRANKQGIHKALVSVYTRILEFYKAAFEILSRRRVKLVLKMVLENNRLPLIVNEFLRDAEHLHRLVQNATAEIVHDIATMLYDQEIARWLGGDKIERQVECHAALSELRAAEGWAFLTEHPNFIEWHRNPASTELAILGDMGTGKSVAAAFLIDDLMNRRNFRVPRPMVCYHYCQDDETGRTAHILCVLILSLLEQLPGLKKIFHGWYKENQASGNMEPARDPRRLGNFLKETLGSLDRPLFIVIDGLDECDRQVRSDVLALLRFSSHRNHGVKYILLSRPNKEILDSLRKNARIDMVSNPERDRAIVKHIVERHLEYLSSEIKGLVINQLSQSANGSALWTKMVVKLIEGRKTQALGPMCRLLDELPLPSHLSMLYDTLFLRHVSDDSENQSLARVALKILAASTRPVTMPELAWATALAMASADINTVGALADLVDQERVIALIRPFVTLETPGSVAKGTIRLVHHSVKEYVAQKAKSEWLASTDRTPHRYESSTIASQYAQSLEPFLLNICIRYLLLDEIDQLEIFSAEQMAIQELPQEIDLFDENQDATEYTVDCTWDEWERAMIRYDPTERGFGEFFTYASCHWLDYLGVVGDENLPSLRSIEAICKAGSTRLDNWTQQNCRPGCVVKPRFEFDSRLYDPLGIVSLYGSDAMLHHMVEFSDLDTDNFLSNSAIAAIEQILRWGDLARLRILVLARGPRLPISPFNFWGLVLEQWNSVGQQHRGWDDVFALMDQMADGLAQEKCANELLCMASRVGCLPLIHRLFNVERFEHGFRNALLSNVRRERRFPSLSNLPHQSVGEAVLGNHVGVVEFLLQQEGIGRHLTYVNAHNENVLHLAAANCNPALFRLLVPHSHQVRDQIDARGRSALVRVVLSSASLQNRLGSAETLLTLYGAGDSGRFSSELSNALCVAVQLGDLEMCSLLLSTGSADPQLALMRDPDEQLALRDETPENTDIRSALLQLLKSC